MSNYYSSGTSPLDTPEYIKYRADYSAYLNDYYYRYLPELEAYNRSIQQHDAIIRRTRVIGAVVAILAVIGVASNSSKRADSDDPVGARVTPDLIDRSTAEIASLNSFWDEQSQRLTGQQMLDPTVLSSSSPNCLGLTYGAAYCPQDATISVDLEDLVLLGDAIREASPGSATTDEAIVSFVLAHEYGHHVQKEIGIIPEGSRNPERVADCFAGAAVHRDGSVGRDVLAVIAYSLGDDNPLSPHQTPIVRQFDAVVGYDLGVDACFHL